MAKRYLEDFSSGAHSRHLLYFHLVIVTKYRQKVLTHTDIRDTVVVFKNAGKKYGVCIENAEGEADHIHFLLSASPTTDLPKYICVAKSFSSRILKEGGLETQARSGAVWSPSYCLLTTGGAPIDVIRRYIERQGGRNSGAKMD